MNILYVFFGAGLGGILRYALSIPINKSQGLFPLGTIFVNALGCFLAGILLAFLLEKALSQNIVLFLITGFLGGFTTFSAFSLETFNLLQLGHSWLALTNILLSLSSLCMTGVGYLVAQKLR